MNDIGADGPIADASTEVQHVVRTPSKAESQGHQSQSLAHKGSNETLNFQSPAYSKPKTTGEDTDHELPTRWWYASTGFPLLAGTFGPMANAFSICALVENWRVEVPPGGTEEHGIDIPDPKWLVAVNAVSLVFALIANLSLLLNMAKRVPFRWAQPVTIFGFWISSVLLTVLVGIAGHDLQDPNVQNQALSQAYYYACWAAGLYQLISILMCVTVYGALTKRYSDDFNLTLAQRSLMLQTIAFLTYLLIGALIFSKIEGWTYPNAVYWADFTLLTVGLGGDVVPTTHLARGLLFPFSIGGIVTLGLVVSSIRSMILDRGKRKLHARMTEKMRRKVVKQIDNSYSGKKLKRKNVTGLDNSLVRRLTLTPTDDPEDELDRRRAEFEAMRRVEQLTSRRQKWMNLSVSTTAFAILWFIGAVVFWQTEGHNQGWSYFEALYFSWTSLLTIGYGDLIPLSNAGRPFFVFWSLLAVPSLTILISDMGDTVVKIFKDVTIWVGEVTILPSDEGSMLERLRYGIDRTLKFKTSRPDAVQDEEEMPENDTDSGGAPFQQPGLVRLFKFGRQDSQTKQSKDNEDRLAKDFEEAERKEEEDAHAKGDQVAEDEHHYRHILISEIRKLYTDSNRTVPKKYSYEEWAYYLKLLGEDESSSNFHRQAPVKSHQGHSHAKDEHQAHSRDSEQSRPQSAQENGLMQWSWIGPRSPLMTKGDQSESEWLVTRLFERLEESLRDLHQEKEQPFKKGSESPSASSGSRTGTPMQRPATRANEATDQIDSRSKDS